MPDDRRGLSFFVLWSIKMTSNTHTLTYTHLIWKYIYPLPLFGWNRIFLEVPTLPDESYSNLSECECRCEYESMIIQMSFSQMVKSTWFSRKMFVQLENYKISLERRKLQDRKKSVEKSYISRYFPIGNDSMILDTEYSINSTNTYTTYDIIYIESNYFVQLILENIRL